MGKVEQESTIDIFDKGKPLISRRRGSGI